MNTEFSIPLSEAVIKPRAVKSCALYLFRAIRSLANEGQRMPGRVERIREDVAEAWRESAQK